MRILVLGGTSFVGSAIVDRSQAPEAGLAEDCPSVGLTPVQESLLEEAGR